MVADSWARLRFFKEPKASARNLIPKSSQSMSTFLIAGLKRMLPVRLLRLLVQKLIFRSERLRTFGPLRQRLLKP